MDSDSVEMVGTAIGAGGGALAGGLMGAIIAGRRRRLMGAGIGAAAGGLAGGVAGHGWEVQAENARHRLAAQAQIDASDEAEVGGWIKDWEADADTAKASEASRNKDYFSEADLRKAQQNLTNPHL